MSAMYDIIGGPCKVTITDKEGKILMVAEGFIKHHRVTYGNYDPVYSLGSGHWTDHLMKRDTEMSFDMVVTRMGDQVEKAETKHYLDRAAGTQPIPQYFSKKPCNHDWRNYEGFMEKFQYCALCNEKKNES
jgi:hypothetical protein